MEKAIFAFVENCVACKACEIACAIEHSQSKSLFGAIAEKPQPRSRVKVDHVGAFSYPSRCLHCEHAACVVACPTGAMKRHPDTHAVYVDASKCVGCWICVMVCPFGGVSADPVAKNALKCDRCPDRTAQGLDPACVSACPTKAMVFATPEAIAERRRQATALGAAGLAATRNAPTPTVEMWRALKGGA